MRCGVWCPLQSLSNRTLPAGKKEKVQSEEREREREREMKTVVTHSV